MIIKNADGERSVPAENFFMEPSVDIERMRVLAPGDILAAINIPNTWSDETFYFEKVADRNTWDFALLNIAAAMRVENDRIVDIRIACGGVECVPRRLTVVEDIVKGTKKNSARVIFRRFCFLSLFYAFVDDFGCNFFGTTC